MTCINCCAEESIAFLKRAGIAECLPLLRVVQKPFASSYNLVTNHSLLADKGINELGQMKSKQQKILPFLFITTMI